AWRALTGVLERATRDVSVTVLPPPSGSLEVERLLVFNAARDGAIIQGITFKAEAGDIVGIIGPSGAGKSTLVRMIAGAGMADQGAIRFGSAEMRDWDPERLARRTGYMPQETQLVAGTVME